MKPCLIVLSVCLFAAMSPTRAPEDNPRTPIATLALRLLDENGLTSEYEGMVDEFKKENRGYNPPGRLERVSRILDDPLLLEPITIALRDGLEHKVVKGGLDDAPGLLALAADAIDFETTAPATRAFEATGFPQDHIVFIEEVLDAAALLRSEALSELTDVETERAYDAVPVIIDKFIEHIYLGVNATDEQIKSYRDGLKALMKVDLGRMTEAAMILCSLVRKDYVRQIRKDLARYREKTPAEAKKAGFSGDIIAYRETRHGPVVIGGRRATHYNGRAAFILAHGGNDTYSYAAATLDGKRGLSMVVDVAGKDEYITEEHGSLAAARLGVSLLFDLSGNDRYKGTRRVQGFGGGGVALLWDERGKDAYTSEENAQGSAFFGLGLLVDREEDDAYASWLHAQGFGLTKGLGALLDGCGNDTYTATGHYPCTYGQEGVFHASSQGHGTGLRRYKNAAAPLYGGGIGLLCDAAGDDRYDAGNFSQGCGYFFGYGILADRSGDDWIRGSRYTQGTGAHQAMGIVINDEGDDEYISSVAANQAGTWDVTAGMFLDFEGNDSYKSDGLAQAGTAQTAFALLYDGGGSDKYFANGNDCQGSTGSYEYHDIQSFSFFLDLGGGKDKYNRPKRKDNTIFLEKWYGIFADFRQKTIKKVLKTKKGSLEGEWGQRGKN